MLSQRPCTSIAISCWQCLGGADGCAVRRGQRIISLCLIARRETGLRAVIWGQRDAPSHSVTAPQSRQQHPLTAPANQLLAVAGPRARCASRCSKAPPAPRLTGMRPCFAVRCEGTARLSGSAGPAVALSASRPAPPSQGWPSGSSWRARCSSLVSYWSEPSPEYRTLSLLFPHRPYAYMLWQAVY